MNALDEFLNIGVLAFILTFVRVGTTVFIMPGIGDSFTPQRVRLFIAMGLTLVLAPFTAQYMPSPIPPVTALFFLVGAEFIIGLFFGTVARIFMMALDTAGMVISISSGLGNAQVFNPSLATQGSIVGAFLSVTGVLVLFALNLHHMLIVGIVETYQAFPVGVLPDDISMLEVIARGVSAAFAIGVKIGAPFIILTILIYVGMGVLARLMPQVQVFLLALPAQILLAMITLAMILTAGFSYWAGEFEAGVNTVFLR